MKNIKQGEEIVIDTNELLDKLYKKYQELGRTPLKEDVDKDKNMPTSSTYYERFGGITNAFKLLNIPINRVQNLTIDNAIEFAKKFYNDFGRAPMVSDFDNTPNYPHSSYIRKDLKLTWNQFLIMADLPVQSNGDVWIKNSKAEKIVEDLLKKNNVKYEYLSYENTNALHSFIINDNMSIDVRYSSPINDKSGLFWKFKLHMKTKKSIPDYFICVGFNEFNEYDTIFVIPTIELAEKQEVVSVNIRNKYKSKYSKYESLDLEELIF